MVISKVDSEERIDSVSTVTSLFEASPVAIAISSLSDGKFLEANQAFLALHEYTREEVIGHTSAELQLWNRPEEREREIAQIKALGRSHNFVLEYRAKSGKVGRALASACIVKLNETDCMLGFITELNDLDNAQRALLREVGKKQAIYEQKLAESERNFRSVIEHSPSGIYVTVQDRIVYANARLCDLLGLPLESLLGKDSLDVFLKAEGVRQEVKRNRQAVWRTGETSRVEASFTRPDGSEILMHVYGAGSLWDGKKAIVVTVEDITEQQRAQAKIAAYVKQLENSMRETVLAIANMVEKRDPYTAGHERRVGIIAGDIAREMGWSEERCKHLPLIGLVHDIGKIAIPAEILTRPTRFTDLEYEIVKSHAEQGYQILKDVHFPIPIAEIIRQHHERFDGTGYPQGLRGEQILPEARILAVADVLESMASHRPYRPALGLDAGMQEIEGHRSTWFDPKVVDALVRLVREKNYQLPV